MTCISSNFDTTFFTPCLLASIAPLASSILSLLASIALLASSTLCLLASIALLALSTSSFVARLDKSYLVTPESLSLLPLPESALSASSAALTASSVRSDDFAIPSFELPVLSPLEVFTVPVSYTPSSTEDAVETVVVEALPALLSVFTALFPLEPVSLYT